MNGRVYDNWTNQRVAKWIRTMHEVLSTQNTAAWDGVCAVSCTTFESQQAHYKAEAPQSVSWLALMIDEPGFVFQQTQQIYIVFKGSRPVLGPTELPVQWIPRINRRGINFSYSVTSGEFKNEWSYTPTLPICFHGVDRYLETHFPVSYHRNTINTRGPWLDKV